MNIPIMRYIVFLIFFDIISVLCTSLHTGSLMDPYQCVMPRLSNGRIRTRSRGRIIRFSCYADYKLVGNRYSTCIRGSWDTPIPICVSTRCPPIPTPKHAVVGAKYHGAILMYFCEPGYVLVGNAEIYCVGRQWNGTAPYCRDSNATALTSCNFEEGLCSWEQDPKHDFDWIRHRYDTPSAHIGTGPTYDHTLGFERDGYYLYIEASGRLMNDTARIISPLYNASLTESGCFSFWYHMYGATIGSLNLYFQPETEEKPNLMWSKNGNQGNQWLHGLFDLPLVNSSFQIIIEGVRGTSYVSDIAIDDVAILQGDECNVKNVTSSTPANDGDEVEIFNAMQSCRDRCVNALTETTVSSEVYSNSEVCQCTLDCAANSNCCPDYAEYCIYEVTDMETIVPTSKEPSTSTVEYTETYPVRTSREKLFTDSQSTMSDRTTESPTTTTTARITTAIVPKIETTVETRATTKAPTSTLTIETAATAYNRTTLLNPVKLTTVVYETTKTQTEENVLILHAEELERPMGLSFPGIIGIVIGIVTGITITGIITLTYLRNRKSYKRSSNGSAFSEDSDVRFLTSDEVLDFNLAKPAGEYEEQ